MCVVVDDERIVLGLLEAEALAGDPATPVDQVMRSAPATLRPHLRLEEVAQHLAKHKTHHVLITTPEGRLIGVVERSDLEPGKGSETIPR
jgi:CBS domain-containing protein